MKKDRINDLKRVVFLAYHQDGILDLVAATVVLGFGVFMLTDNIAFLATGWLAMLLYPFLKRRITIPRFGYVRFDSQGKSLRRGTFSVGIGVLVLLLFFLLNVFISRGPASPELENWIRRYHMVPLSTILFALPALLAAVLLGLKRYFLYALLAAGLPALGALLELETYLPILATGLVALVFGIVLLITFLGNTPARDEAGLDGSP